MEFRRKQKLNIVLLTTKTMHHDYFIKVLERNKNNKLLIIFEQKKTKPLVKIGNLDMKKQISFERKNFFNNKKYKFFSKNYKFSDINSYKCMKLIKKFNPEVGVVFGTGKISPKLIKIFKGKLINIHRGIMTKYRGLDSEFWASYHRDFRSIGTTVHFINKFLDKGKTIFEKKLILKFGMKAYMLRYFTTILAAKNINNILKKIKNKKVKSNDKQNHGRYYSFIPLEIKKIAYQNFNKHCLSLK